MLTDEQYAVLAQYADTDTGKFLQGLPGASALWHEHKLLDWHGQQYGCNFYSITDAGREALLAHQACDKHTTEETA